jgi:hypothetical protein
MEYTKPEVNMLGEARSVIEVIGASKPTSSPTDGTLSKTFPPAYDLDE